MSTPVRLALFVAALGAVFGLAVGTGALAGPVGPAVADEPMAGHDADAEGAHTAPAAHVPKGLQTSQDGYSLVLDHDVLPAGTATVLSFRVLNPRGAPLTAYETSHDEDCTSSPSGAT